ncbi:MAG: response regulator [Pseudomonadota bacterium]
MSSKIPFVLLIDDEGVDRMIYRRVLERSGLVGEITMFEYADDALDFLKLTERPKVDVIFLDINMPRMNGFEFLEAASREIGDNFADAVIVMLTTSLDPKDHDRAMGYDVVKDFINKPLTIEHVQQVAKLLRDGDGL